MEPGAYYYRRQSGEFELLKAGNFRREAGYLCLEQPLGADCSALVCYMADLERGLDAIGNRAYRDAHLEAGLHGGRAYLAAYAYGQKQGGEAGGSPSREAPTRRPASNPHATGPSASGVPDGASMSS